MSTHLRAIALSAALFAAALGIFSWLPGGAAAITAGRPAPEIDSTAWINSKPLTLRELKGRVIMVEFWTYG